MFYRDHWLFPLLILFCMPEWQILYSVLTSLEFLHEILSPFSDLCWLISGSHSVWIKGWKIVPNNISLTAITEAYFRPQFTQYSLYRFCLHFLISVNTFSFYNSDTRKEKLNKHNFIQVTKKWLPTKQQIFLLLYLMKFCFAFLIWGDIIYTVFGSVPCGNSVAQELKLLL